jgi:hypothetical protein
MSGLAKTSFALREACIGPFAKTWDGQVPLLDLTTSVIRFAKTMLIHALPSVEAQSVGSVVPGVFAGKWHGCNFLGVQDAHGEIARPVQFGAISDQRDILGRREHREPCTSISPHVYNEAQQPLAPMQL